MKQYIYNEPERVEVYQADDGSFHTSRDGAIAANVERDMKKAMRELFNDNRYETLPVVLTYDFVTQFVLMNSELVAAFVENKE